MSWQAIILIVVEVLKQRSAAGWPLLKMLLDYFSGKVVQDAEAESELITVGAAPDAVKDQIVAWLEKKKATANIKMKLLYAMMIRFVPMAADQIWDALFAHGRVAKLSADFPPTVGATGHEQTEEEILADLV